MQAAPTAEAVETVADSQETSHESAELSDAELIADEVLVEEISIDGMCGVY
jgi:mycofactocin precursor